MDAAKQMLKGSPSRDLFKQMHKRTDRRHYATDIDLAMILKYPWPHMPFYVDHKNHNEPLTFAEVVAYNDAIMRGQRVFIVRGNAEQGPFVINEYIGGHHLGPTWTEVFVCEADGWGAFEEWEASVRKECADRFDPKEHTHGR